MFTFFKITKASILSFLLACSLCFVSCNTTKGIVNAKVYDSEVDVVSKKQAAVLPLGKFVKSALTKKNPHVADLYCEKNPVAIYKLEITKSGVYNLILKSLPHGIVSQKGVLRTKTYPSREDIQQLHALEKKSKKSAVIPVVSFYDSDFNLLEIDNLRGGAQAPIGFEDFLYKVTGDLTIKNPGTYYLVIKPDMSSDEGLTLYISVPYGYFTHYFVRTTYGKYKVRVKKIVNKK